MPLRLALASLLMFGLCLVTERGAATMRGLSICHDAFGLREKGVDPALAESVQTIVQSIRNSDSKLEAPAHSVPVDFEKDSDIVIFFHPKDAAKIEEKGFLSQHESKQSSGHLGIELRSNVEDAITGMELDSFGALKIRPKSALVIGTGSLAGVVSAYNASSLYGGSGAVLKPQVKERAIWTYGDSLQVGQEIMHGRVKPEVVPLVRGTFDRKWMALKESLPETRREPEFVEALIFGELTLDDVDHFVVQYESSADALMGFGKPIFLVTHDSSNGIQFRYKRIMNFGDSIPLNLPHSQRDKILDSMERYRGKKNPKIGPFPY
jgi:hypothetical protein